MSSYDLGGSNKLDGTVISNLLSALVNCNTTTPPDILDNRIKELLQRGRNVAYPISEQKLLEAIGSIYCLSLLFAINTRYNRELIMEYCSLAQSLVAESLVVIQSLGLNKVKLSDDPLQMLSKDNSIEARYCLEIFTDSLELVRAIVRDVIQKLRHSLKLQNQKNISAKEKEMLEKQTKLLNRRSGCVQPYAMYFMCCFALSHIAAVLKANQSLSLIPGIGETITAMMLTVTTKKSSLETPRESAEKMKMKMQPKDKDKDKKDKEETQTQTPHTKISFDVCMDKSHKLSVFMAHVLFDTRYLHELRLAKGKLVRQFSHPDIVCAEFRSKKYKKLFQASRSKDKDKDKEDGVWRGRMPSSSEALPSPSPSSSSSAAASASSDSEDANIARWDDLYFIGVYRPSGYIHLHLPHPLIYPYMPFQAISSPVRTASPPTPTTRVTWLRIHRTTTCKTTTYLSTTRKTRTMTAVVSSV